MIVKRMDDSSFGCRPTAQRRVAVWRRPSVAPAFVVAGLWLVAPAVGDSDPRDAIRAGVAAYERGDYQTALDRFDAAAEGGELVGPLVPELLHNRAAALYRLGRIADAREAWVQSLSQGTPAFEARSRYNLGNCAYQEALAAFDQQESGTVREALDRAIVQYRDAIRLDPSLQDARANLELAAQLKKKLDEQSSSQPSSQPNENQDQQQEGEGEGEGEPSDSQQNEQQQDQSQDQEQSDSSDQQESQQQSGDNQQQQQQQEGNESDSQEQQPQPDGQQGQEEESQQQPQDGEQQGEQQEAQSADGQSPVPIELTPEQAERLLQLVRDAEKARREALAKRQRARQKKVERDW